MEQKIDDLTDCVRGAVVERGGGLGRRAVVLGGVHERAPGLVDQRTDLRPLVDDGVDRQPHDPHEGGGEQQNREHTAAIAGGTPRPPSHWASGRSTAVNSRPEHDRNDDGTEADDAGDEQSPQPRRSRCRATQHHRAGRTTAVVPTAHHGEPSGAVRAGQGPSTPVAADSGRPEAPAGATAAGEPAPPIDQLQDASCGRRPPARSPMRSAWTAKPSAAEDFRLLGGELLLGEDALGLQLAELGELGDRVVLGRQPARRRRGGGAWAATAAATWASICACCCCCS